MKLKYPYDVTGPIPRCIHDLDTDLIRDNPRTDWKNGDMCFVYVPKRPYRREIRLCTVVYVRDDFVELLDLEDRNDPSEQSITAHTNELFDSKEQILEAIFGPDPSKG